MLTRFRLTAHKLSFFLLAAVIFSIYPSPDVFGDDGPPWSGSSLDDLTYREQAGWKRLDEDIQVSSDTGDFAGGYVELEIIEGSGYDELRLVEGGDLSCEGDVVYWNGTKVGKIDDVSDGSTGRLLIQLSAVSPLENPGFESGSTDGWDLNTAGNQMRGYGWAEGPDSLGYTADSDPEYDDQISGSSTAEVSETAAYEGNYGLLLQLTGGVDDQRGTGHAPSATSSTFSAEKGDSLTVHWRAFRTDDFYDVFGFLFDDSDGDGRMTGEKRQLLFHDIGSGDGWLEAGGGLLRLWRGRPSAKVPGRQL